MSGIDSFEYTIYICCKYINCCIRAKPIVHVNIPSLCGMSHKVASKDANTAELTLPADIRPYDTRRVLVKHRFCVQSAYEERLRWPPYWIVDTYSDTKTACAHTQSRINQVWTPIVVAGVSFTSVIGYLAMAMYGDFIISMVYVERGAQKQRRTIIMRVLSSKGLSSHTIRMVVWLLRAHTVHTKDSAAHNQFVDPAAGSAIERPKLRI